MGTFSQRDERLAKDWGWLGPIAMSIVGCPSLYLGEIRTGQTDLAKMDFSSSSNIPTGAIQWSAANSRWERYNGSSFEALIATYNINVQNLGGQSASFYRNANNINAGTIAAARLPAASTSAQGAVQLSASTTSNSQTTAATPSAVNAIRQLADGKADASHTHSAGDLPSASTSAAGIVRLNTSTSLTSTSQAATPSAVRVAYNLANGNHTHSLASSSANGFMSAADKSKLDTLPFRRTLINNTSIVVNNSTANANIFSTTFNVVSGRSYKLSAFASLRQQNDLAGLQYGFYLASGSQPVTGDVRHLTAMMADAAGDIGLQVVSGRALAISGSLSIIITKGMYNTGRMLVNSEGGFVAGGTGAITLVLAFTQNAATSDDTTFYNGWMSVDEVG